MLWDYFILHRKITTYPKETNIYLKYLEIFKIKGAREIEELGIYYCRSRRDTRSCAGWGSGKLFGQYLVGSPVLPSLQEQGQKEEHPMAEPTWELPVGLCQQCTQKDKQTKNHMRFRRQYKNSWTSKKRKAKIY